MSASEAYLNALTRLSEVKAHTQAEAARASGQIWGNTIANIGQMVAQYPEQQAKLKEIANRADLTNLERQKFQYEAAQQQRQMTAQQAATQALSKLKKTPDNLWDVPDAMDQLSQTGLDPQHIESFTTGLLKMNDMTLAERKRQDEANADRAHSFLSIYKDDEPITPESMSFNAEALKGINGLNEADAQAIHDITNQVPPGTDLRPLLKSLEQKKKEYQPVYEHAPEGSVIYEKSTGKVLNEGAPKLPKTKEEILFDSLNPASKTQAISQAAWQKQVEDANTAIANKPLTPYEKQQQADRDREFVLATKRYELALKNSNKTAAAKAGSDIVQAVIDHPELWGQLTPTTKANIAGELEKRGFTAFQKPPSATVENRLASAKAVTQTGNDIIAQLKDPKIAGQLGPAMGRYNTLREFLGNPPPELSELAGSIESFALANMGVHGMRSVQGADEIKSLLDRKHTPESLIKTIEGLNKFSAHFMENEGTKAPTTGGGTGLPAVGSTFQGGKVLKVTPVP